MKTFAEKCVDNQEDPENIDEYIKEWHESDSDLPIHDFLGICKEAYNLWVSQPDMLSMIILAKVLISQFDSKITLKEEGFYPELLSNISHVIRNRDDFLDDVKKNRWTIRHEAGRISDEEFEKLMVMRDVHDK